MKVTSQLSDWLDMQMQDRNLSFSEMARITGTRYQTWQKIYHHHVGEIKDATVQAICQLYGVTQEELIAISEGRKRTGCAKRDGVSKKAEAVWRWLNHDPARCAAMRAMGYKGDLPIG
jgi:DNA-binding Xre family transcriptional regulator